MCTISFGANIAAVTIKMQNLIRAQGRLWCGHGKETYLVEEREKLLYSTLANHIDVSTSLGVGKALYCTVQ